MSDVYIFRKHHKFLDNLPKAIVIFLVHITCGVRFWVQKVGKKSSRKSSKSVKKKSSEKYSKIAKKVLKLKSAKKCAKKSTKKGLKLKSSQKSTQKCEITQKSKFTQNSYKTDAWNLCTWINFIKILHNMWNDHWSVPFAHFV